MICPMSISVTAVPGEGTSRLVVTGIGSRDTSSGVEIE